MKQTAVEWLADNLHYLHSTKWDDILEQAKEMEKEMMCDFAEQWFVCFGYESAEEYYNKVFNTKER